jgi:AcrR family transcriptional regulator
MRNDFLREKELFFSLRIDTERKRGISNMGRRKTGLDERILNTADRLFYAHGYTNTGINQIVTEAGTNKPGLYTYFKTKDDLARRYLAKRNLRMTDEIVELGRRATGVLDFFRLWIGHDRHYAAGKFGEYNGCPIANFALQTDANDKEMQKFIEAAGKRWEAQLVAYVRGEIKAGKFPPQPGAAAIARRMLICNEGAITMWKLTGKLAYFDEAIKLFEASVSRA